MHSIQRHNSWSIKKLLFLDSFFSFSSYIVYKRESGYTTQYFRQGQRHKIFLMRLAGREDETGGIRTRHLLLRRQLLYPNELRSLEVAVSTANMVYVYNRSEKKSTCQVTIIFVQSFTSRVRGAVCRWRLRTKVA